jgi:hypothetical protein
MKRLASNLLAPGVALLLAFGLHANMDAMAASDDSPAFHQAVREAVDRLPARLGDFDSTEQPLPPAAGKLLHPNAHYCRRFVDESGRWVTLLLVHCRDSRDMSGHYPPNCYPGSGWTQQGPARQHLLTLWNRQVPIAEYRFTRSELQHALSWTIYDFFVLPAGGFVTDMNQVRRASGDYRTRPYGAAQIQVILDSQIPEPQRLELLNTVLEPLTPVIDRLQLKRPEGARHE